MTTVLLIFAFAFGFACGAVVIGLHTRSILIRRGLDEEQARLDELLSRYKK